MVSYVPYDVCVRRIPYRRRGGKHYVKPHGSVLARGSCKERCFLRDQSIAMVLITFFRPHQRKMIYLRAEEHRSLARTLPHGCCTVELA